MRRFFVIAIMSVIAAVSAFAQTPTQPSDSTIVDIINAAGGSITIVQPQALNLRLKHSGQEVSVPNYNERTTQHNNSVGYRIQVFSDNNARTAKSSAQSKKSMIQARFAGMRAYVTFQSPYWRVRVGDFRTRAEAESAMAEIRAAFPSMSGDLRIVKDRINPGLQ